MCPGPLGCLHALILKERDSQAALKEQARVRERFCTLACLTASFTLIWVLVWLVQNSGWLPASPPPVVRMRGPSRLGSCFSVSAPLTPPGVFGTIFSSQCAEGLVVCEVDTVSCPSLSFG